MNFIKYILNPPELVFTYSKGYITLIGDTFLLPEGLCAMSEMRVEFRTFAQSEDTTSPTTEKSEYKVKKMHNC